LNIGCSIEETDGCTLINKINTWFTIRIKKLMMKEAVEYHMTGGPSYVGLLGVFCVTYMLGKDKI
jgi:hypothetical protein